MTAGRPFARPLADGVGRVPPLVSAGTGLVGCAGWPPPRGPRAVARVVRPLASPGVGPRPRPGVPPGAGRSAPWSPPGRSRPRCGATRRHRPACDRLCWGASAWRLAGAGRPGVRRGRGPVTRGTTDEPARPVASLSPRVGLPLPERAVSAPAGRRQPPAGSSWRRATRCGPWPPAGLRRDAADAEVAATLAAIYALNRAVVGADPDLIRPGQRLRLPRPPRR